MAAMGRSIVAGAILAVGLEACGSAGGSPAMAAPAWLHSHRATLAIARTAGRGSRSDAASSWSTLPLSDARPVSVALTLYARNWALVRDIRRVDLTGKDQVVRFAGVAAHLDPAPPLLDLPAEILASRFTDDLGNKGQLLARYAGQNVEIFAPGAKDPVPATLVNTAGGPRYRVGDRLYEVPDDRVVLPILPGMSLAPALWWQVRAARPWSGLATASYAATDIGWTCDYSLTTDAGQTSGNWTQWATLSNHSGAAFAGARITLVAGQVQRTGSIVPWGARLEAAPALAMPAPALPPQDFAARYEYLLPEPLTLGDDSSQRIDLAQETGVGLSRSFRFENSVPLFASPPAPSPEEAQIRLTIVRGVAGPLAGPIPAGIVTVYTPDHKGAETIAGQARVLDTPARVPVHLDLGQAFGITMVRKQTLFETKPDGSHELAFELGLSNHQGIVAPLEIVEHLPGDWSVVSASTRYTRPDATDLVFSPVLAPHTDLTVSYEVHVKPQHPPGY